MKNLVSVAAVALVLGAAVEPAVPGTINASMQVSATVIAACTSVSASPLAFGNVVSGGVFVGNAQIDVSCSNGTFYSVDLDNGLRGSTFVRNVELPGGVLVPYTIYTDTSRAQVWGTGLTSQGGVAVTATMGASGTATHPVHALIAPATGTPPGTGADTVTVTVTY